MARLPPGAHLWENDSRADYPLRYYYQEVLGMDLGFTLHSLFGLAVTEESARAEARDMHEALREGSPVFVSTLGFPMRAVLDQLWLLLDPDAAAEEVRGLDVNGLRTGAPFIITDMPVDPERAWVVHRLGLRG
jgi:hypothetical protein